jgi:DNA-binding transcriptional regulator/RsmH inhibitor MraZ
VGTIGQPASPPAAQDAPRGVFRVSVDDKGRLKLPASIVQYLEGLGERKVFITTLDELEARIYPLSVWRETEKMLQERGDDFKARRDVALIAANYGQDVDVDAHGRVTLPADLRKLLGLEGDEIRLHCFNGHINVLGSREYGRRLEAAKTNLADKLLVLEGKGL